MLTHNPPETSCTRQHTHAEQHKPIHHKHNTKPTMACHSDTDESSTALAADAMITMKDAKGKITADSEPTDQDYANYLLARIKDCEVKLREYEVKELAWADEKKDLQRQVLQWKASRGRGKGKNNLTLSSMGKELPVDAGNFTAVSALIVGNVFRLNKFLKNGWDLWDDTPRSICMLTREVVKFPNQLETKVDKELYWTATLVPMINKKMSSIKSNITQLMKRQYLSETISFSFLPFMIIF